MGRLCINDKRFCKLTCVIAGVISLCCLYIIRSPPLQWKTSSDNTLNGTSTISKSSTYYNDISVISVKATQSEATVIQNKMNYSSSNSSYVASLRAELSRVEELESTTSHKVSWGYLLSVNIAQQMTGAIYGYLDLATLGGQMHLSTVEPYVQGTGLVGIPAFGKQGSVPRVMKLSTLYDFETLQNTLKSCSATNNHYMSSFETFLKQSSRSVVLVHVLTSLGSFKSKLSNGSKKIADIGLSGKTTKLVLKRLNQWASYVSRQSKIHSAPFRISRVLAIDARPKKALHLRVITNTLGSVVHQVSSRTGSVTVLFVNWRAIHNKPDTGYFYYIPEYKRLCRNIHDVGHSHKVINTSHAFATSLNDSQVNHIVGVHIRGERLLQKYKKNFAMCFKQLRTLLNKLISSVPETQVRVIHDMGKYGTKSCHGFCQSQRPKVLSLIKKLGHRVVSFKPDKFPSVPHHSAFAAFVEREYLSRMDELVTVGSGGFSNSIAERFLRHSGHSKAELHRICK